MTKDNLPEIKEYLLALSKELLERVDFNLVKTKTEGIWDLYFGTNENERFAWFIQDLKLTGDFKGNMVRNYKYQVDFNGMLEPTRVEVKDGYGYLQFKLDQKSIDVISLQFKLSKSLADSSISQKTITKV